MHRSIRSVSGHINVKGALETEMMGVSEASIVEFERDRTPPPSQESGHVAGQGERQDARARNKLETPHAEIEPKTVYRNPPVDRN